MTSHYALAQTPAVGKMKASNRWVKIDISAINLVDLFATYKRLEVPVLDFYQNEQTLYLHDFEPELKNKNITLVQWFGSIGNRNLRLKDGHPSYSESFVPYVPLNYHDTKIKLAKAGAHPSHDADIEDFDDLIINLTDFDSKYVHKHCLFSSNGFFLPSKYHDYGVRLLNAGDVSRASSRFDTGFLNFEKVGSVKQIPITKNMVTKIDEDRTYFHKLTIDTIDYVHNKTVGIVIAGYLHLLDGFIKVIGPTTITLSLANASIKQRVLAAKDILDLSFMGLDDLTESSKVDSFYIESNVLDLLTSKYSFLVLIDNSELMVDETTVSQQAMDGTYITGKDSRLGHLVDHLGRTIDYWPVFECGQWALKTKPEDLPSQISDTVDWRHLNNINDAAIGSKSVDKLYVTMKNYFARDK